MPVIAINEIADGRVAVVGTDSLWRWKLEHVGKGGDDRHYDQILSNMVKWLIKDPDLDLVKVTPSAGVRALGESVDLEVRIFTPDYKPANGLRFELKISRRQGLLQGETPTVVYESKDEKSNAQGRWSLTRTPTRAGVYDVTAVAKISGRRIEAKTVFVVSDERPEMRQVHSNTQLMDRLANATGGKSLSLSDRKLSLDFNPPRVNEVTNRRYHERWNLPGIFFLGCALFGLEWWLRRRWGFL
ncbi:MAG TPA: hypothetical protein EYN66_11155 [Myxococcales bacterium]|nr:hypothetical protein [Myxococcales bacterium]